MFNSDIVRPGDILLYAGQGIIQALTFSKYGHAAIYSGDGNIIESHLDSNGVVEKELNQKWYDSIDIYRPLAVNATDSQKVVTWLRANAVDKIPYDIWSFFSKFVRSSLGYLAKWTGWRVAEPWLNNRKAWDCAETVAVAYLEAIRYQICKEVNVHSVTPGDLGRSSNLFRIS